MFIFLRNYSALAALLVFGFYCCSLAGCGPGGPKTVPVAGAVTLGNQPVASGTVTLKPLAASDAPEPVGTITNGQYTLATGTQEGCPPGKYKVIVNASVPSNPSDPYSVPKSLVPAKYTNAATTDLEIEVVAAPAADAYDLKLIP